MTDWVRAFSEYIAAVFSGVGVALIAAPLTRKTFAAFGTELAIFPEESEVTWERTSSNSYRIAWQNGFPDRRSREDAMSASFELFRNGDIAIITNNVTRYVVRELPFDCAGRGQATAWVAANYPSAQDEIAAAGSFAVWVENKDEYTSLLGVAGGIRVHFVIEIQPTDVPFFHLDFMEVPQVATDAPGYFAQPQYADYLDHGKHGAGEWNSPNDYNQLKDTVSTVQYEQPWLDGGSFTWPISYVWRLQDEEDSAEVIFAHYTQRFELDANGTARIKKFGYCAERTTNNVTRVTGGSQ